MSQTMNKKPNSKKKKISEKLQEVEVPEELTGVEKIYEAIKPHLTTIGLVIVAGLLGFIAIAFLMRSQFDKKALQSRELFNASTIALRTGDTQGLEDVAANYPDTKPGLWALQMAGDHQLRLGLDQLSIDREAGNQLIEKAKVNLLAIVDAPQTAKTTMLDRRSHFSLAYAYESLGQLDEAKEIYNKLVEEAPDSAFADPARRGSKRASNPQYAALYNKFANFEEEVIGEAPAAPIPEGKPNIDFNMGKDLEPGQKPPVSPLGTTGNTDNDFDTSGGSGTEDKSAEDKPEMLENPKAGDSSSDLPPKPDKEEDK